MGPGRAGARRAVGRRDRGHSRRCGWGERGQWRVARQRRGQCGRGSRGSRTVVGRRHGVDAGRGWLLVGRPPGGRLQLRRCRVLRLARRRRPQHADRRPGGCARRPRLLAGRRRRRDLQLTATPRSTARWAASRSTSRSSAWPRRPTGTATGSWRPTAASSPTATPRSTARSAGAAQPTDRRYGRDADGRGYWFVAADGGIFGYGDATFYGSMGGKPLEPTDRRHGVDADGRGYWFVAADGGIFASATRRSTARWAGSRSTNRSSA